MESERRLIAAGLVALLACGLWYVWDDRTVDEALLATDRRRGEATAGEEKDEREVKNASEGTRDGELGGDQQSTAAEETPQPNDQPPTEQPVQSSEDETPPEQSVTEDEQQPSSPPGTESQEQTEPTPKPQGTEEQPTEPKDDIDEPPTPPAPQESQTVSAEEEFEALYHSVCPPESAGQVFNSTSTGDPSNSVFVVNGLSALGARLTFALAGDAQWQVLSIASSRDRLCGDELVWHRQDVLREKRVQSIFVDWSDSSAIGFLFEVHRPSHVVVVPPNIGGGGAGYTLDSATWAAALHDFVVLLETLKTVSPSTRLTLMSVSKSVRNELEVIAPSGGDVSLLETLVGAFELSLSTYHTLYQLPFSILRLKGLYGPWTKKGLSADSAKLGGCFIDDVVVIIRSALSLNYKCVVLDLGSCDHKSSQHALEKVGVVHLTSPARARAVTDRWRNEYKSRKGSRLVLTSYFTGHGFRSAPDRHRRLGSWVESISRHGLGAVVLHNGLGRKFVARCHDKYPHLDFELVSLPFDFGRNSTCRQSVLAFADYLERRADIGSVVVMDLERSLRKNVFPAIEALGDWLYSDLDIMAFRDVFTQPTATETESGENSVLLGDSLVLGGSRHLVLATLNKMADCLQSSQSDDSAAVLKCLMDRHLVQYAFMGWPLSSAV